MTAPWSATTLDGRTRHLPRPPHDLQPDPARPLVAASRPITDEEYERAWRGLYAGAVHRLDPAEAAAEIEHLQRERALYAGDLRSGELDPDEETVARNSIAVIDVQLADLERHARRLLRAELPDACLRAPRPDFSRARYVDLVGLAETLTAQHAVRAGVGRYRIACPFHDDARPSLLIYPPGGGWYCFACQAGGPDAASFAAAFFATSQTAGLRFVEQLCDLPGAAA